MTMMRPLLPTEAEIERARWGSFLRTAATSAQAALDPEVARAAEYWPDSMRVPTWPLFRALLRGDELPPAWQLVRTLEVTGPLVDDEAVLAWARAGHLRAITRISLREPALSARTLSAVCQQAPNLVAVELHRAAIDVDALAGLPSAGVVEWSISSYSADWIRQFLQAPVSQDIRRLTLSLPTTGSAPWWDSARLSALDELHLFGCQVRAADAVGLAARLPAGLRALTVTLEETKAPVLQPILQRPWGQLETLNLARSQLRDADLRDCRFELPALRQLDLSYNRLSGRMMGAIVAPLSALRGLYLAGTKLTDRALAGLGEKRSLRALDVSHTKCTGSAIGRYVAPSRACIEALAASGTGFDTAAAKRLAEQPAMPHLSLLELADCELDGEGFIHLMNGPGLPGLTALVLSGCRLGICDFAVVGNGPYLSRPHLRSLWLDRTEISVPRPSDLFDPARMPALEDVRIGDNLLSTEAADALAAFARAVPLRQLDVRGSVNWGPAEFDSLLAATSQSLDRLWLGNNPRAGEAIISALHAHEFPRLDTLDLLGLSLTAEGIRYLVENRSLLGLATLTCEYESLAALARLQGSALVDSLQWLVAYGPDADQALQQLEAAKSPQAGVELALLETP